MMLLSSSRRLVASSPLRGFVTLQPRSAQKPWHRSTTNSSNNGSSQNVHCATAASAATAVVIAAAFGASQSSLFHPTQDIKNCALCCSIGDDDGNSVPNSDVPTNPEVLHFADVSIINSVVKVEFDNQVCMGQVADELPFPVVMEDGQVPFVKQYGSLFGCNNGTMTVDKNGSKINYKIRTQRMQTQPQPMQQQQLQQTMQQQQNWLFLLQQQLHAQQQQAPQQVLPQVPMFTRDMQNLLPHPMQSNIMQIKQQWELNQQEQVTPWIRTGSDIESKIHEVNSLPVKPFPIRADRRTRYELKDKFIFRKCFNAFEKQIEEESKDAEENGRVAAVSVLGPKGAGKSVFFRYFCCKHCSKRLVLYIPDAGTDADAMYRKCMEGLIHGLQCLVENKDNISFKQQVEALLSEVRMAKQSGRYSDFMVLWSNWLKKYPDICQKAYVVIDQIQREGELFNQLRNDPIECAGYILISSTGILHHHNVTDVYKRLVYNYPVSPEELVKIDTEKRLDTLKLDKLGTIMTMMLAISILENVPDDEVYQAAAKKHYRSIRRDDAHLLKELLAVVQSAELEEEIDGVLWDQVVDANYMWVDENKMVQVVDKRYLNQLKKMLTIDKVNYKKVLMALLSDPNIVNEVGNAALGIHVEALLDITWQDQKEISWKQLRHLRSGNNRNSRAQGSKKIKASVGETFENIQPVIFDGMVPSEDDLKELDWDKPVYFKPRATNYAGFDMFLLEKRNKRYIMHAIQVTVKNAVDHDVDTFDQDYLNGWNNFLQRNLPGNLQQDQNGYPKGLEWRFCMLTPEDDPGPERPASVDENIPIYQVGFKDLKPSGDFSCGIKTVNDFANLLKDKKNRPPAKKKRTSQS